MHIRSPNYSKWSNYKRSPPTATNPSMAYPSCFFMLNPAFLVAEATAALADEEAEEALEALEEEALATAPDALELADTNAELAATTADEMTLDSFAMIWFNG